MKDPVLRGIGSLVSQHSGIFIRDQDYDAFAEKVGRRVKTLGLASLADYHNYLRKELATGTDALVSSTSPLGQLSPRSEWQELYSILTINESYFFRDSNQLKLLAEQLLPNIINRKLAIAKTIGSGATPKPRLRIWSAGCSTGEELYSIAIALDQLKFPWDQWDTLLIGTDISKAAVDSARRGLYGSWSFRQVPDQIQQTYFQAHNQLYKICDRLQQHVVFHWGNLLNDPCPSPAISLESIDLIICRNVFIYLDSQAIGQIIQKFHGALGPQGYLLTGHTELYSQDTRQFETLSFPASIVYQKPSEQGAQLSQPKPAQTVLAAPLKSHIRPTSASPPKISACPGLALSPAPNQALDEALQEAETLLRQEAYAKAIQRVERLLRTHPDCDDADKIAARAHANMGRYDRAKQLCHRLLSRDPLSIDIVYLLAQIAEDQNELEVAKEHLRKVIYLDSHFVKAYLDLGSIYEREKQTEKAQKMRRQALSLLAKLPPESALDGYNHTTVAQWQEHLEKKLEIKSNA